MKIYNLIAILLFISYNSFSQSNFYNSWQKSEKQFSDILQANENTLYNISNYYFKSNDIIGFQSVIIMYMTLGTIQQRCEGLMRNIVTLKFALEGTDSSACSFCLVTILGTTDLNTVETIEYLKKKQSLFVVQKGMNSNTHLIKSIDQINSAINNYVKALENLSISLKENIKEISR